MALQAIIGLGNPGSEYERTRHNAGFWFVDALAARYGGQFRSNAKLFGETTQIRIGGESLWLMKPSTFMNKSGNAVQALCSFYKISLADILVAHDEIDLAPGVIKLKQGGGHGGNNGLRDIHRALGPDYARLRIGIGHPGHKDRVVGYVLNRANKDDERAIEDCIADGMDAVEVLLQKGWNEASKALHTAKPQPQS